MNSYSLSFHFLDRFSERLPPISKDFKKKLLKRSLDVLKRDKGQDEMIRLIDFNDYGFRLMESELWIIIRNKKLITTWLRNVDQSKTTYGSRVDQINYVDKWSGYRVKSDLTNYIPRT